MALCDYLINSDIAGYDCASPMAKGAENKGLLINRGDIEHYVFTDNDFTASIKLKCGYKKAYTITQSGKTPFAGTQQEMVEGTHQNTVTNTVQFTVLKQDGDTAQQLFALMNGEFVAVIPDRNGNFQAYGLETGLHASAAVRELYNDDTLAGWLVTMTEEGATRGSIFISGDNFTALTVTTSECIGPPVTP